MGMAEGMVKKRVLMISYHYPPLQGSSGIQRTLKFSQYLSEFGWHPIVLSAHPRAFQSASTAQMGEIPDDVIVHRAFALDTSRHLAIFGRYPLALALPDRWVSWVLGAVPAGLGLIRKHRPEVIWSTYPIASAHLIGLILHRLTGIPWVADFRDSMTEDAYPPDPTVRRVYQWLERQTIRHCTRAVFTTPSAVRMYRERYPEIPGERFCEIPNGYDEENFANVESRQASETLRPKPFVLLHSGIIYPSERDPRQFFAALAELAHAGKITSDKLQVVLRATQHDDYLAQMIQEFGIGHLVQLQPPIPYHDALSEMLAVDALLILQASNCNHQIPAKIYEYFRAQRPILALTDPEGDTATTLRRVGVATIAPLDSKQAIIVVLTRFLEMLEQSNAPLAHKAQVLACSRWSRTEALAQLLDEV